MDASSSPGYLGQRPDGFRRLTFIECRADVFVEGLKAWFGPGRISSTRIRDWRSVWNDFPFDRTFELVSQATPQWAVHCDNGRECISGLAYTMARRLKTRAIRFHTTLDNSVQYPVFQMEYHDGRNPEAVIDRVVGIFWTVKRYFASEGEPLPFEELDAYAARRVVDRMTHERLCRYARILGFDLDISAPLDPCYMLLDNILKKADPTLADKLESARAIVAMVPEAGDARVFFRDAWGRIVTKLLRRGDRSE